MKKIIIILAIILVLPLITALDYPIHKQNTQLNFSITSNNATACNLSTINAPGGNEIAINQDKPI